jgi:ribosome recycling factor
VLQEADTARRKLGHSKEDGRMEALDELEKARKAHAEAEDAHKNVTRELQKLREDHADVSTKLASSLLVSQVRLRCSHKNAFVCKIGISG